MLAEISAISNSLLQWPVDSTTNICMRVKSHKASFRYIKMLILQDSPNGDPNVLTISKAIMVYSVVQGFLADDCRFPPIKQASLFWELKALSMKNTIYKHWYTLIEQSLKLLYMTGYFWSSRTHDKLIFEGSIFVHFHLL